MTGGGGGTFASAGVFSASSSGGGGTLPRPRATVKPLPAPNQIKEDDNEQLMKPEVALKAEVHQPHELAVMRKPDFSPLIQDEGVNNFFMFFFSFLNRKPDIQIIAYE